jgi:release factor glutamine methyltransferase
VAQYEPHLALDGGPDGLRAYRCLLPDLPRLLNPGGLALLELGAGQASAVSEVAANHGLASELRHDLAGIARAIVLQRTLP